ncbi:MAG: patatin-like phospholipase family protein [Planctomycetota bacterium]|jgi:hypothetical protein
MARLRRFKYFLLGVTCVLAIEGGAIALLFWGGTTRPEAPPGGVEIETPWGALDWDEYQPQKPTDLQRSIAESIESEAPGQFDLDQDSVREYDLLALPGGGSQGAFGAGFLCGWSERGDRPIFKVVTGVSTGALQATPAFLGPEYDYILRDIFTQYGTDRIYRRRPLYRIPISESVADSAPLKALIDRYMTAEVLAAVAAEYEIGRRLYIGTLNMDTWRFVIWDMGAIASSGRPDALKRYRDILLASSAVQVFFPPVYIDVVGSDGRVYSEMHSDGATYASAFFRGFLLDFDDAMTDARVARSQAEMKLFVIVNGTLGESGGRANVRARTAQIAATTIAQLLQLRARASFYRMYTLAGRYGMDFNMVGIPEDFWPAFDMLTFDTALTTQLFERGRELGAGEQEWLKAPPGLDTDELVELFERPGGSTP